MKLNHSRSCMLFLFIYLASFAKSTEVNEQQQPRTVGFMTSVLDIIFAPLTYFSTSGLKVEPAPSAAFRKAWHLLKQEEDEDRFKAAYSALEECAIEGDPHALYHMGCLMLGMPEHHWQSLQSYVRYDPHTGRAYLKESLAKGLVCSQTILDQHEAHQLIELASERMIDDTDPQASKDAKSYVEAALMKNGGYACFYVAEALLKGPHSTYPWMAFERFPNFYKKRVRALHLLSQASKYGVKQAQTLYEELRDEDQFYEAVCSLIYDAGVKELSVKELKLGQSGFQEAFIDQLCENQVPVIDGKPINKEFAEFLKYTMNMRVNLVFLFFSDYFQYLASIDYRQLNVNGPTDVHVALNLMQNKLVGLYEIELPIVTKDIYAPQISKEKKKYDFRVAGLFCPLTILDATTAYRKFVGSDEDFNNYDETHKSDEVETK